MTIEGHTQTCVYIRTDLYTKARGLDFNMSEFVNHCLESVLIDENTDIANLLNEERALRARLAEIQTKKSSIQPAPLQQIRDDRAKAQNEREVCEKEQAEAQELFKRDPDAYIKKYLGDVE
jgi:post-segregation antitoxin (ccd killing protein)